MLVRRWSTRWPRCSGRQTGRGWPAASTIRASRCWPGTPRRAKPLTPVVTWQDKRSQEVLDRLEADGGAEEIRRTQRDAARPLLLRRQAHLAARERRRGAGPARPGRCGSGRSTRSSATGSEPGSQPIPRPLRAPSSGRLNGTRRLLAIFGVPADSLPEIADTAGDLGTLHTPSGRSSCRCGHVASTSKRRSPVPAASSPAG